MMAFKDLFNFKKNPKIELPWTKKEVWLLFIALLPLYFQFQEFYAAYQNMPSTIPIHFNLEGVVDGRAPKELLKWVGLFEILLTSTVLFFAHKVYLNNMPLFKITERNAEEVYRRCRLFMLAIIGLLNLMLTLLGHQILLLVSGELQQLDNRVLYYPLGAVAVLITGFLFRMRRVKQTPF